MKQLLSRKTGLVLTALSAAVLTGCGSSSPAAPGVVAPGAIAAGACVAITQTQLGFTGTNIDFNDGYIVAGQIPNGQNIGTLALTGAVTAVPGSYSYSMTNTSGDVLAVSVTNNTTTTLPITTPYTIGGTGTAALTGYIQIGSSDLEEIELEGSGGYGYGGYGSFSYPGGIIPGTTIPGTTTTAPTVCISAIAIQGEYNVENQFLNTYVYLYLNSTAHGYELYF